MVYAQYHIVLNDHGEIVGTAEPLIDRYDICPGEVEVPDYRPDLYLCRGAVQFGKDIIAFMELIGSFPPVCYDGVLGVGNALQRCLYWGIDINDAEVG